MEMRAVGGDEVEIGCCVRYCRLDFFANVHDCNT